MGKGQAAILLIIIALVVIVLFFSPQIFRPSAVTEPVRYKNDIITLENFQVSNLKPVAGGRLTIDFDLMNNGDKTVNSVEVTFLGTNIGTNLDIKHCENVRHDNVNKRCRFTNLLSLDTRRVVADYTAPDVGSANIEVQVKYPYSGTREAFIPIIDDKTVKKPPAQFKQSQPSFGPFAVDIMPPTKGWAIADHPFEIKFKLKFVGSTATGMPLDPLDKLKIEKGRFIPSFKGGLTQLVYCQLDKKDIVVNEEYSCNLYATGVTGTFGYKLGIIEVGFNYDFGFKKSQTITVRPLP